MSSYSRIIGVKIGAHLDARIPAISALPTFDFSRITYSSGDSSPLGFGTGDSAFSVVAMGDAERDCDKVLDRVLVAGDGSPDENTPIDNRRNKGVFV